MGCSFTPVDNQEEDENYNNINKGGTSSPNDNEESEDDEQFKDFEEIGSN